MVKSEFKIMFRFVRFCDLNVLKIIILKVWVVEFPAVVHALVFSEVSGLRL